MDVQDVYHARSAMTLGSLHGQLDMDTAAVLDSTSGLRRPVP